MDKPRNQLFYTFLGYVLILLILIVVALIIGAGIYWIVLPLDPTLEVFRKEIPLIVVTPVVFGYVVKASREHWRSRRFRMIFAGLFLVHTTLFWAILRSLRPLSPFDIAVVGTFDLPLVLFVSDFLTRRWGKDHHRKTDAHGGTR